MDWPCQDFTQGSTREQPSVEAVLTSLVDVCLPQRLSVAGILPVAALQLLLVTSVTRAKLGCSEEADKDVF